MSTRKPNVLQTTSDHGIAPTVLVVAAALISPERQVLVAQRPPGKSMAGLWEFPGGKVEPGERPEAALARELAEELTLDITVDSLAPLSFASHEYGDFHLLMLVYACRRWRGAVCPREGQAIRWVDLAALRDLPMPPADQPVLGALAHIL